MGESFLDALGDFVFTAIVGTAAFFTGGFAGFIVGGLIKSAFWSGVAGAVAGAIVGSVTGGFVGGLLNVIMNRGTFFEGFEEGASIGAVYGGLSGAYFGYNSGYVVRGGSRGPASTGDYTKGTRDAAKRVRKTNKYLKRFRKWFNCKLFPKKCGTDPINDPTGGFADDIVDEHEEVYP